MKFAQVIEYDKINIFFSKNHAENEAERLIPVFFLFSKDAFYELKSRTMQLSFNIF